jgi:uncharacterized protein (TIGR03435 family)
MRRLQALESLPSRSLFLAATAIAAATFAFPQSSAPLKFEVATIKPVGDGGGKGGLQILPGGGIRMSASPRQLISFAYSVPEDRIAGGSKWMDAEVYELFGKPEGADPADNPRTTVAPGTVAWDRLCRRLQSLLEERFALAIHKTSKEAQGYTLSLAKTGTKLKPSPASGPARTMRDFGKIEAHQGSMTMLAAVLSNMLGSPVVDNTGLKEAYDYKLEYTQEGRLGGRPGAPDDAGSGAADPAKPSIFSALQEQLGLKLERGKVATETIVIDRATRPTAN